METTFYELSIEEQKQIYGGEQRLVGFKQLENGEWVKVYDTV